MNNRLPLPKETREKKPWTSMRQIKYGIVVYVFSLFLSDWLDLEFISLLGTLVYAGSFSIYPIVPKHLRGEEKKDVAKKFKRNLRLFAVFFGILAVISYVNKGKL